MSILKILKDIITNLASEANPQTTRPASSPQSHAQTTQSQPVEHERTDREWEAYFRDILSTEFAQYSVRENVAVTDVVGNVTDEFQLYKTRPTQAYKAEWGKPYTFVLEQMGVIKGVVMLGKGHSHDSNVKYLISRMYAKKMRIPYINFYTQMANEKDYVVQRIRRLLN